MNDVLLNPVLIEAVQKAAQEYGIGKLAAEMDMRPSSLYNALNPWGDRSVAKLGLEAALYIIRQTGDVTPLDIMARECDCLCIDIAACPDHNTLAEESVDDFNAVSALSKAMLDGESENEIQRLAAAAHREIEETVALYLKLRKREKRAVE